MTTTDVRNPSFDEEFYRDRISAKAYEIWESEGRPHGGHERHWDQAKRIIEQEVGAEGAEEVKEPEKPLARPARNRRGTNES